MLKIGKLLAAAAFALTVVTGGQALSQTTSRDLAAEEANRQLVVDFYNRIFTKHDMTGADIMADDYIQHNPKVPNGKAPFVEHFTRFFAANKDSRNRIVRSAANGDLVWLHVHARGKEDGTGGIAIVDIFRVENGKIVEHWDVAQPVPDESANGNTMF
ncbi:nuclear transport factor 2 family protein [Mesorhizobium sp. M0659]|uniref:nuclear transport factor 2 family protein n=1 Tax=Mesorhizobium sp. M0659 TaxID=2956980 RepID=UPI00333574B3